MSLIETADVLAVDKNAARDLLMKYRAAKAPANADDQAIMTAYREIARGRVVIQAAQSIRNAGWYDEGAPKLAMTRADVRQCQCYCGDDYVTFQKENSQSAHFRVNSMPPRPRHQDRNRWRYAATVPLVPLHVRPKHDLRNYWILWEADWTRSPIDPLLLRRLKGDLWIVLAAWELTTVERAVLEQRVSA